MANRGTHIGFFLSEDRPNDKKIIDVLNSLPPHENKCSYIRKAILFYSRYSEYDFESSSGEFSESSVENKLDEILSLLKSDKTPVEPRKPSKKKAEKPKEEELEDPKELLDELKKEEERKRTSKSSPEPVSEQEVEPETSKKDDELEVDAESDISESDFDSLMGDFLNN